MVKGEATAGGSCGSGPPAVASGASKVLDLVSSHVLAPTILVFTN